jgi:RHS repeat-associated protein
VTHAYGYNALNRLTGLVVADQTSSTLASYNYALGLAGNRTSVTEFGGRRVDYSYDNLYRLTMETITGAVGGTTYAYDPVGNRSSRSSPSTGLTFYTYDANDRLSSDTYDNDGNTVASGGNAFSYDFENHLVAENGGTVSIVYDGDGNRIAKTVGGATTQYLVDDRNLTGYAQVLEELSGGAVQRTYTYGLNRISQSQAGRTSFYGYDGHGDVRLLTDSAGAATDRYDYDAFGNVISQTGTTPNAYLYAGEQLDQTLGLYYLRARYYRQATGRFVGRDAFEGLTSHPTTQHAYAYTENNPVNNRDPSGRFTLAELSAAVTVSNILNEIAITHLTFAAVTAIAIDTLYEPGFEAQNAALQVLATTDDAATVEAATTLYQRGRLLVAAGSGVVQATGAITQFGNAVVGLGSALANLGTALKLFPITGNPFAGTGSAIQGVTTALDVIDAAGKVDDSAVGLAQVYGVQGGNTGSAIRVPSNLFLDNLRVFLSLSGKIVEKLEP